jgi:hypothetical protein
MATRAPTRPCFERFRKIDHLFFQEKGSTMSSHPKPSLYAAVHNDDVYSGQRVSKGVKRRLLIERNGTMLNRKPSKTIADITFEALWRRLYQSWTAFHAQEELSRLSQRDWYDNEIFWRDDIPYIVQYGYHWSIVRHDEIEQLLALEDRDLTAMGLHRGDLEAYRDGRIKFLNRRSAAQPTAADQDNARHGN